MVHHNSLSCTWKPWPENKYMQHETYKAHATRSTRSAWFSRNLPVWYTSLSFAGRLQVGVQDGVSGHHYPLSRTWNYGVWEFGSFQTKNFQERAGSCSKNILPIQGVLEHNILSTNLWVRLECDTNRLKFTCKLISDIFIRASWPQEFRWVIFPVV